MDDTQNWEYRVKSLGNVFRGPNDDEIVMLLDEWGEEGWDLVSAFNISNSSKVTIIAKRPLSSANRRRRDWPE